MLTIGLSELFFFNNKIPSWCFPTVSYNMLVIFHENIIFWVVLKTDDDFVSLLQNSLSFATQIQQCIPVICQLLGSKNSTDVLEAIQFFVTAVQFGVSAAGIGVRRAITLVWSQEQTVREALVEAYRELYIVSNEKGVRWENLNYFPDHHTFSDCFTILSSIFRVTRF